MRPLPKEASLLFTTRTPKRVKVKPTIVCWLDLLGLSARLQAASTPDAESAFIAEYLRVLRPIYTSLRWRFSKTGFRWNAFTDSIVLSANVALGHPESSIGSIAMAASEIQFRLACQGWFLRGGFALGALWASEEIVVGSGLMAAYKLETKTAIWPRIVLDSTTRDILPSFMAYYAEPQESPQNHVFARDEDGQVFLNYLFTPIDLDYAGSKLNTIMISHRDRVLTALATHTTPGELRDKYLWVAAYHNWFCSNWFDDMFGTPLQIAGVPSRGFARIAVPE